MNRRRASAEAQCENQHPRTQKKKYRHSHLHENIQLKNVYTEFFEQQCPPTEDKQKIHFLSKSLQSLRFKYLIQNAPMSESSKCTSLRESRKTQSQHSDMKQKNITFQIKQQNLSKFFQPNQNNHLNTSFQRLSNLKYSKTDSHRKFRFNNLLSNSQKVIDQKLAQYEFNQLNPSKNLKPSFKIKVQGFPNQKLIINRQNKQNQPHKAKQSISISEAKSNQKQNRKKSKYEVKRLWQIKAIQKKRKQNQTVHQLILNEPIPTVKIFKPISFKISEQDTEEQKQTKKKNRVFHLTQYDKVLKQVDGFEPRYGLRQKAMSLTKLKMLQYEGKNLYNLY